MIESHANRKKIIASIRSALSSVTDWLIALEDDECESNKDEDTAENEYAEWVENDKGEIVCSNCGHDIPFNTEVYYTQAGKIIEWFSAFCPNCGKRIKNKDATND